MDDNQRVALIGKSGSGKTVSTLAIFGLLSATPGVIRGKALFRDMDLLAGINQGVEIHNHPVHHQTIAVSHQWQQEFRRRTQSVLGKYVGFVFQEPYQALDPYFTIGEQLMEVYRHHEQDMDKRSVERQAIETLSEFRFSNPQKIFRLYPHELSGGMCQRITIMLALAGNPGLVIADEPTTALDTVTRYEIMRILIQEQTKRRLSLLFITHDMKLVRSSFQKIAVMANGLLIEWGNHDHFFGTANNLNHPYTRSLLGKDAVSIGVSKFDAMEIKRMLEEGGCRHLPDCPIPNDDCRHDSGFIEVEPEHFVRCHRVGD
ncbi:MAG: ABC transporter ATP-binding protein [bacterium]